jgi:DNA polymerase V
MEGIVPMDDQETARHEDGVSVHAGFPNPAADRRLKSLDFNQLLIAHPASTFVFRVHGDEGMMQGIFDGDIVVVDRLADPGPSGFVLWHDGERFKLSRPGRVADGARRWGVITAVIHQYR